MRQDGIRGHYVAATSGVPLPTRPRKNAKKVAPGLVTCVRCELRTRPGAFHVCIDLTEPEPVIAKPEPKPKKKAPKPRVVRPTPTCACGKEISKDAKSCRSCEGKRRRAAGATMPTPRLRPIEARLDEIVRRYVAGENTSQIATDIGVTPGGIRRALRREGVAMRSRAEARRGVVGMRALTGDQAAAAAHLYKSGLSMDAVADHFGISQHAVSNALRRLGVQARPRGGNHPKEAA